ncbi:hypothetical protein Hanom_Chr14g01289281 [Helianthus anomalus]
MSATKKHCAKVCAWVRPFGDDLCEEFQGFMKNDRRLRVMRIGDVASGFCVKCFCCRSEF